MKINTKLLTSAVVLSALSSQTSSAALITWDNSVQMYPGSTTQEFVNTSGSFVYGINADSRTDGTTTRTVNGVGFVETNLASLSGVSGVGGVTMATTIGGETGNSYGDGSFNGDGDIFNLITSGFFNPGDVTFSGLTSGQEYLIQVFVNDARGGRNSDYVAAFSNGVDALAPGNAAFAKHSNRDTVDGSTGEPSGDYIIGRFTAVGTTQSFSMHGSTNGGTTFNSGGRSQINGIQLRAVPEPSALFLGSIGALALLRRRTK